MAKKKPATKPVAKSKAIKPAAKSKAPAKKVEAKKPTKPAPKKAAPAKATAKKVETKKAAKPAPKKAAPAKAPAKKVEAKKPVKPVAKGPSKAELAAKAKVDAALLAKKNKEQEKLNKLKAKEDEKKAKELAKLKAKEEKEKAKLKAKGKGKKGQEDLPFEGEEEERQTSLLDEEEDDDFESDKPAKVKMTFDEVEDIVEVPIRRKKPTADDDIKEALAEEILALSEEFKIEEVFSAIRNMELFKVESDECVVRGCDNPSTSAGYCRFHYIKLWKEVKKKEAILTEGKLAKMIEELVRKYPMKYVESIISDLADDKAFYGVLKELDIEADESDLDTFEDDDLLDDDQDIAFETKVTGKPMLDD